MRAFANTDIIVLYLFSISEGKSFCSAFDKLTISKNLFIKIQFLGELVIHPSSLILTYGFSLFETSSVRKAFNLSNGDNKVCVSSDI